MAQQPSALRSTAPPVPHAPSTLRDVASAAGVSVATASRVLSGNPATSSASREAVTAAAEALDFRPNAQARALRSSRTGSIGLLIPDIRNPHFADLAHSVEMHARERGLVTLVSAADERLDTQEAALRLLMSHNVDGLVVVPQGQPHSDRGSEALEAVVRSGIPLVLVDRFVAGLDGPAVVPDTTGLRDALAELLRLGHKRIALIAGPASSSTGRERRAAYEDVLATAGLPLEPALVHEGDFQPASGREGVERFLALSADTGPSAVVVADGPMAIGAMAALAEHGVRVPEDLSVVAHDDLDAFRLCAPPLSAVAQDVEAMGAAAVELLADLARETTGSTRMEGRMHAEKAAHGDTAASGLGAGGPPPTDGADTAAQDRTAGPPLLRHPTQFIPRGSVAAPRFGGSGPRKIDNHREEEMTRA